MTDKRTPLQMILDHAKTIVWVQPKTDKERIVELEAQWGSCRENLTDAEEEIVRLKNQVRHREKGEHTIHCPTWCAIGNTIRALDLENTELRGQLSKEQATSAMWGAEVKRLREVARMQKLRLAWHRGEYKRMYDKTVLLRERCNTLKGLLSGRGYE